MVGANKKTMTVTAHSYKAIERSMAKASREVKFIPIGGQQHLSYQENGGPFFESYVEDLEFPKVIWKVTRRLGP